MLNVLHLEGKLPPEQDAFMKDHKPPEELFDLRGVIQAKFTNLADDPMYSETLKEFRGKLAAWRAQVGDSGVSPEFRSGGWPATYPTRPLEEWLKIESEWEDHLLHGGKMPDIPRPAQYFPETKS